MRLDSLTDKEVAADVARKLRAWRLSPQGAGMSQAELSVRSGVGTTPIKRFEKTGGITLASLVALLRALGLLDRLETLVPDPDSPGPLDILEASRGKPQRQRASRKLRNG